MGARPSYKFDRAGVIIKRERDRERERDVDNGYCGYREKVPCMPNLR